MHINIQLVAKVFPRLVKIILHVVKRVSLKIFVIVIRDKILVMSQETYYVRITFMLYRTTRNSSFADRQNSSNVVENGVFRWFSDYFWIVSILDVVKYLPTKVIRLFQIRWSENIKLVMTIKLSKGPTAVVAKIIK